MKEQIIGRERDRAINKFIDSREPELKFGDSVTNGVNKYPELLRNEEYRNYAFQIALLRHKLILLQNGLSYGEVYDQSHKIQQSIAKRNGKGKFIGTIDETWKNTFATEGPEITADIDESQIQINEELIVSPQTTEMEPNKEISLS